MLYFFLVWKHPCLSSLFALGFFPLFSLLEKQILQFAGCGWHLPEDLHIDISTLDHWGTCLCKVLCIFAHLKGNSDHISPVKNPEHHFSILTTQLKCPSHLRHDKRILAPGESKAQISFHLACSHKIFFPCWIVTVSIKIYGLPNMLKWLFRPHHHQEKANRICLIYLNRDGRKLGGDCSI